MAYVITLQQLADGSRDEHCGRYRAGYNPDGAPLSNRTGGGLIRTTGSPARAQRFESPAAAYLVYQQVSRRVPLRPDGRPNRPLTAYSIAVDPGPGARSPGVV
jgi:hypothetical protein